MFTRGLGEWKESTTLKIGNKSIGEFQIHNNRDCIKFRFNIETLISLSKGHIIEHTVHCKEEKNDKHKVIQCNADKLYLIEDKLYKICKDKSVGKLVGEYYTHVDNMVLIFLY
jgi:hypothetical protein